MRSLILAITLCICMSAMVQAGSYQVSVQDDTVKAFECSAIPLIDGIADDACWQEAKWQPIDVTWITFGQNMDPADFSGRYKVTWSSVTDRMYFLVEVTDDALVKGYIYPANGWWEWDGVELFFDEDASGGDHQYNQNAFAYHITTGNTGADFEVMDVTTNGTLKNYSDHFDVKIQNDGNVYIWELSMIVYNESYNPNVSNNPAEQLEVGRVSGLSMAYNDNDNPNENPKTRDNFIGSVQVTAQTFNDHWKNASLFGKVQLLDSANLSAIEDRTEVITAMTLNQNYPNPFNPSTTIEYTIPYSAHVLLSVYDIQGKVIAELVNSFQNAGNYGVRFDGTALSSGIYFIRLQTENDLKIKKMVLLE